MAISGLGLRTQAHTIPAQPAKPAHLPWFWLLALSIAGLMLIMLILMPLAPDLQAIAGLIGFILIMPLGALLFFLFIIWPLLARKRPHMAT